MFFNPYCLLLCIFLGSPSYDQRECASFQLCKMGMEQDIQLELNLFRQSKDPEVRRATNLIIDRICRGRLYNIRDEPFPFKMQPWEAQRQQVWAMDENGVYDWQNPTVKVFVSRKLQEGLSYEEILELVTKIKNDENQKTP